MSGRIDSGRDELKRRFSGLNQECDPHFRARIGKRFEITDRLFDFIDGQRRSGTLIRSSSPGADVRSSSLFDYFEREFRLFEGKDGLKHREFRHPLLWSQRGRRGDDAPAFAKPWPRRQNKERRVTDSAGDISFERCRR
jgi:hypothetical protein